VIFINLKKYLENEYAEINGIYITTLFAVGIYFFVICLVIKDLWQMDEKIMEDNALPSDDLKVDLGDDTLPDDLKEKLNEISKLTPENRKNEIDKYFFDKNTGICNNHAYMTKLNDAQISSLTIQIESLLEETKIKRSPGVDKTIYRTEEARRGY
jgi:hypothetical protein